MQGTVFQAQGTASTEEEAGLEGTAEGSGRLECGELGEPRCEVAMESHVDMQTIRKGWFTVNALRRTVT